MRSTLLAASLGSTWNLLENHGYNPDNYFQEVGLDPEKLMRAEARFDLDRAIRLFGEVDGLFRDPCLGLKYNKYWHPSQLHALGYAWISSKSLTEALQRLVRYAKILTEGLAYHMAADGDEDVITIEIDIQMPPAIHRLISTALAANLVSMCRMNYRQALNPLWVGFEHAQPPCAGDYFAFFKAQVRFGMEATSVAFDREVLDRELIGHNPQLAKHADQVLARYLAEHDKADIAERVKMKIAEMMPSGEATAKNVARKLYLSNRSLNRRLSDAGTSYRDLLDETRSEMASHYLKDRNVDLREIPYLLGYKSYSSFFRAHKRWTGQSPTEAASGTA